MTSVSVRFNQSESISVVMSTLHASQITTAVVQANNPVSVVFFMVSKNVFTICLKNSHTEYGKCVATVPLFSETSDKEFSCALCEEPVILVELLLELRNVVIQGSEDAKRSVRKKTRSKNSKIPQNVRGVTGDIGGLVGHSKKRTISSAPGREVLRPVGGPAISQLK